MILNADYGFFEYLQLSTYVLILYIMAKAFIQDFYEFIKEKYQSYRKRK